MLTDKQKKEIIASYVECENYSEVGRRFNLDEKTIRNIVKNDKEFPKIAEQKREENTKEVLEAMKERNSKKIAIIDKIFEAMEGKLKNIDMFTNIKDLATAYGIILDKELKFKELEIKNKETGKEGNIQRIQIVNDLPEEEVEDGTSQD
jgi:hypothetical protein